MKTLTCATIATRGAAQTVQPSFRPALTVPNQGIDRSETITSSGEVNPGQ